MGGLPLFSEYNKLYNAIVSTISEHDRITEHDHRWLDEPEIGGGEKAKVG
jgi:hypothetical protein